MKDALIVFMGIVIFAAALTGAFAVVANITHDMGCEELIEERGKENFYRVSGKYCVFIDEEGKQEFVRQIK